MCENVKISARRSLRHLDARWIYSVVHAGRGKKTTWYDSGEEAFRAALVASERGARISYYEFCSVPQEREISVDELRRMANGGPDERSS